MRLNHYFVLVGAAAVLLGATLTSSAQLAPPGVPGTHRTPPIAPGTHRRPRMGGMNSHAMPGSGQIVGNKNTKVYHLPGDKGNMPAENNRVYFRTESEATAAGYHAARSGKSSSAGMHHGMPHKMNHNVRPMPGGATDTRGSKPNDTGRRLPK